MLNEPKNENVETQEQELTDIEVAELANRKLKEKDKEIEKLKKDLAREKLLSGGSEEQEEEKVSLEDALKVIDSDSSCNYDIGKAFCDACDALVEKGREEEIDDCQRATYNFMKEVLEEVGDDKSRFTAVYQALLPNDEKSVSMAYRARNKK